MSLKRKSESNNHFSYYTRDGYYHLNITSEDFIDDLLENVRHWNYSYQGETYPLRISFDVANEDFEIISNILRENGFDEFV